MSIHLICGDYCFTSSISFWNKIREKLAIATFDYMVEYRNNLYNEPDHEQDAYNNSVNKIKLTNSLNECIHDIKFSLFHTNPQALPTADSIHIALLKMYTYYLDVLTVLGIAGIFAITNKSDSEGYYSVGNSADIVQMMKIAVPCIENPDVLSSIHELIDLFKFSARENMVVVITSTEYDFPKTEHNERITSFLLQNWKCVQECRKHLSKKNKSIR